MSDPLRSNKITQLAFGPYDNAYLLLGTLSGHLLCLDPTTLQRVIVQQLFSDDSAEQRDGRPPQVSEQTAVAEVGPCSEAKKHAEVEAADDRTGLLPNSIS